MKPKKFYEGQPVAQNVSGTWGSVDGSNTVSADPNLSEIYHVGKYYWKRGEWYISLAENDSLDVYAEQHFSPIITDSGLTEALQELETVSA